VVWLVSLVLAAFFIACCRGYVGRDKPPETGSPLVLLLEGNLPAPRVQPEKARGGLMPDMLPAGSPDNKELAHDLGVLSETANVRESRRSLATVNQVTTSVGIFEESWKSPGFVKPFSVGHGAPELRQVVIVQLPQPVNEMSLLGGGDKPRSRRSGHGSS
jgi:hypothetical protein